MATPYKRGQTSKLLSSVSSIKQVVRLINSLSNTRQPVAFGVEKCDGVSIDRERRESNNAAIALLETLKPGEELTAEQRATLARGSSIRPALLHEKISGNQPARCGAGEKALQRTNSGARKMKTQIFDSVWDAISDTQEEAENMKIRSQLITRINAWIERTGMSQEEAAKALGVTQPRISELARGKIALFSVDRLITMMAHAGMHIISIEISEPAAA